MKVSELIEELKKIPQDLEVRTFDYHDECFDLIEKVSVIKPFKEDYFIDLCTTTVRRLKTK